MLKANDSSIDLHCHTTASDGALSPSQIVDRALERGLTHLAISDHDNTSGIAEAAEHAQGTGLQIIPAIELSSSVEPFASSFHIVGLFIDPKHPVIEKMVASQYERRRIRAEKIGRKLESLGFENCFENIRSAMREGGIITRGNYARYIAEHGGASSFDEAFNRYLRRGQPAYVKSSWPTLEECVQVIRNSGGIAVFAHPRRYEIKNSGLRKVLNRFKAAGGEAMEVSSCQQKPSERAFLAELCLEYGFASSAGSDFHIPGNYRELGFNLAIPHKTVPVFLDPRFKDKFLNLQSAHTGFAV